MGRLWTVVQIAAVAGLLLALGCAGPPRAGGTGPTGATLRTTSASQQVGDLKVDLKLSPFPPAVRSQSTLEITLTNTAGQAVDNAQVLLDLTMPAMPMPPNRPEARSVGAGKYVATARLGMGGQWQIAVVVRRGGQDLRADFFVDVR